MLNKFTEKAQEAILAAQESVISKQQSQMEPEHILAALRPGSTAAAASALLHE